MTCKQPPAPKSSTSPGGLHWLAQRQCRWRLRIQLRVSVIFPPPHFAGPPSRCAGCAEEHVEVVAAAEQWLKAAGSVPLIIAPAIIARYPRIVHFVPISPCALAGKGRWRMSSCCRSAALPPQLVAALRLPVVSYALPALIAIGNGHSIDLRGIPSPRAPNALPAPQVLEQIQPSNGGFSKTP